VGIAKRLYGMRHYGGDRRVRGGKPIDVSPGKRPRCSWCLRGEEAGPLPEDLDGKTSHDECRAELARLRGETPVNPDRPAIMPDRPAIMPDRPAIMPDRPAIMPETTWVLVSGPLPLPSDGRGHRLHDGCGGSGCAECRHTGYATMGPLAIARLAPTGLAPPGLAPLGLSPPAGAVGVDPEPPPPPPPPARRVAGPGPQPRGGQLAFTFD
jgi:hypothetical protein